MSFDFPAHPEKVIATMIKKAGNALISRFLFGVGLRLQLIVFDMIFTGAPLWVAG